MPIDTVSPNNPATTAEVTAPKISKPKNNARSLVSEVSGMGIVHQGEDAEPQRVVDDSKMEGAVYSTSGYGGYIETGTVKMAARPYFKPALDKNAHKLPAGIKAELK